MNYEGLFARVEHPQAVLAGVIGCGDFGQTIVAQGHCVPRLRIPVVADIHLENARRAYQLAGVPDDAMVVCDSRAAALRAVEIGKSAIVEDALLLMDLPLHVIVTATRSPEAGAHYALQAIRHGKHVVMVDKEADSVVGSILKHLADKAGVVFTAEDGDEPGLMMGMVSWAHALGLEVLAAGQTHACMFDPALWAADNGHRSVQIAEADRWAVGHIRAGDVPRFTEARRRLFMDFESDEHCGDPMCHLAVMANGTGLLPDTPVGHRPVVRWRELPDVLSPLEEGGILGRRGVVDTPLILTTPDEPRAGGSIYIVVAPGNRHGLDTMIEKGLMPNSRHTAAVAYRPYHLCGAETPISILCAGLLGLPTGARELKPLVDLVCRAGRDFRAGEVIGPAGNSGWNYDLRASLAPGFRVGPGAPMPFFMLEGNRLSGDVPAGSTFTWDRVVTPEGSSLWSLRRQQDDLFLPEPP
jgi:predicted homoserine dehydrogenase-like protein